MLREVHWRWLCVCNFLRLCTMGTATLYIYDFWRTEPNIRIRIFSQHQPQKPMVQMKCDKNKFYFMDIGLVWRCHANEIRCKYFLEDLRGDDGVNITYLVNAWLRVDSKTNWDDHWQQLWTPATIIQNQNTNSLFLTFCLFINLLFKFKIFLNVSAFIVFIALEIRGKEIHNFIFT